MSKSKSFNIDGIKHNEVFQPCFTNDLLGMKFTSPAWVIKGLVPAQGITIISGAPKSFKSWVALHFALCMAHGQKAFGQYHCEKNNVLIVDEENHPRIIQDRLKKLSAPENTTISFISQKNFCIANDQHIEAILKICEERAVNIIILDSLVRMHDEDENSSKDMAEIFAQIKKLCQNGKTVLVIHHERKESAYGGSASTRMRGSSDISAAIDSQIAIKKDSNDKSKIQVEHALCRCASETDPFEVSLEEKENKTLDFHYIGKLEHKQKETLQDKASEQIIKLLKSCPEGLLQQDLIKILVSSDVAGERTIRTSIKELVIKDTIEQLPGTTGNEKLIQLKKVTLAVV